jgi:hypothetical protein
VHQVGHQGGGHVRVHARGQRLEGEML